MFLEQQITSAYYSLMFSCVSGWMLDNNHCLNSPNPNPHTERDFADQTMTCPIKRLINSQFRVSYSYGLVVRMRVGTSVVIILKCRVAGVSVSD